MRKNQKQIRHYRLKNKLCYNCGVKLRKNYKRTRCRKCLKKEKTRQERRNFKNQAVTKLMKQLLTKRKQLKASLKEINITIKKLKNLKKLI